MNDGVIWIFICFQTLSAGYLAPMFSYGNERHFYDAKGTVGVV